MKVSSKKIGIAARYIAIFSLAVMSVATVMGAWSYALWSVSILAAVGLAISGGFIDVLKYTSASDGNKGMWAALTVVSVTASSLFAFSVIMGAVSKHDVESAYTSATTEYVNNAAQIAAATRTRYDKYNELVEASTPLKTAKKQLELASTAMNDAITYKGVTKSDTDDKLAKLAADNQAKKVKYAEFITRRKHLRELRTHAGEYERAQARFKSATASVNVLDDAIKSTADSIANIPSKLKEPVKGVYEKPLINLYKNGFKLSFELAVMAIILIMFSLLEVAVFATFAGIKRIKNTIKEDELINKYNLKEKDLINKYDLKEKDLINKYDLKEKDLINKYDLKEQQRIKDNADFDLYIKQHKDKLDVIERNANKQITVIESEGKVAADLLVLNNERLKLEDEKRKDLIKLKELEAAKIKRRDLDKQRVTRELKNEAVKELIAKIKAASDKDIKTMIDAGDMTDDFMDYFTQHYDPRFEAIKTAIAAGEIEAKARPIRAYIFAGRATRPAEDIRYRRLLETGTIITLDYSTQDPVKTIKVK